MNKIPPAKPGDFYSVYKTFRRQYNYLGDKNGKKIQTIYEENEGNHFTDATLRMAKGIKWIIDG